MLICIDSLLFIKIKKITNLFNSTGLQMYGCNGIDLVGVKEIGTFNSLVFVVNQFLFNIGISNVVKNYRADVRRYCHPLLLLLQVNKHFILTIE